MLERLTVGKFIAVRRALAAGMRHVEIARELDLSVWTIQKIADDPDMQADPVPEETLPVDDAPPDYVAADLRRCGGCGAMAYHWPCIACAVASAPRVAPEPEVVDELVDRIGWDAAALARCGRKRRLKSDRGYREKLARIGRAQASLEGSAG